MSNSSTPDGVWQDPRLMEDAFRQAAQEGRGGAFAAEVAERHSRQPDDVLLAAWFYRLSGEQTAATAPAARRGRMQWMLALPLGLIVAAVYWFFFTDNMTLASGVPYAGFVWAPVASAALIAFVTLGSGGKVNRRRAVLAALAALALMGYCLFVVQSSSQHYQLIAVLHLPIIAWAAIGVCVAGPGAGDHSRFGFLIKSAEAVVTGGIYAGAVGLFMAVTLLLFEAIGIDLTRNEEFGRLVMSLAAGLVPIMAVATVYDPAFPVLEQRFEEGIARLIFTLGRVFLPLTLLVGVLYVLAIPFNFWRPFEQREVLIAYNAMLFAVMALLVFVTPVFLTGLSESAQIWLRRGIIAVAVLAALVSVYALSATLYRTLTGGGLTINRTVIIGWNLINIGLLVYLIVALLRGKLAGWLPATWRTTRYGMIAYVAWSALLLLALPWLFPV